MYVLSADTLIKEALNAFQNGEKVSQKVDCNHEILFDHVKNQFFS